jgi:hypothetical protein
VANHASDSEILSRRTARRATATHKRFNTRNRETERAQTLNWIPADGVGSPHLSTTGAVVEVTVYTEAP